MQLSALTQKIGLTLPANTDCEITALSYDSRRVTSGALFAALNGVKNRGAEFIEMAIKNGAAAIIGEDVISSLPVPYLQVPDARLALAQLANFFYDEPSRQLRLIGITGTNGKTTTAFLLRHLLNQFSVRAGMLGTIEYDLVGKKIPAPLTTPESVDFTEYLRTAVNHGAAYLVAEISSHALALHRVAACRFVLAIFTNLTRDHLDYHGTEENYAAAKQKLFQGLSADGVAISNADDIYGEKMLRNCGAKIIYYGVTNLTADCRAENWRESLDGTDFDLRWRGQKFPARIPLVGRHNVYNALAAITALLALDFPPGKILAALQNFSGVPGRLEKVIVDNKTAFIDYAHTPDALVKALQTLRPLTPGKIWTVFGCGGDRDKGKRPLMAQAAEQFSDRVVITSDNPRSENPQAIIEEIRAGLRNPQNAIIESDRAAAIKIALTNAARGDAILIAGKGHENYQIIGDKKLSFSDRAVVEQYSG